MKKWPVKRLAILFFLTFVFICGTENHVDQACKDTVMWFKGEQ